MPPVREGREFFAFLETFKENEMAVLALSDEDKDLFDYCVAKGNATEIINLLSVLRPELMSGPDALLKEDFLREFTNQYVAARNDVKTQQSSLPPAPTASGHNPLASNAHYTENDCKYEETDGYSHPPMGPPLIPTSSQRYAAVAGVNGAGYYDQDPTPYGASDDAMDQQMTAERLQRQETRGGTGQDACSSTGVKSGISSRRSSLGDVDGQGASDPSGRHGYVPLEGEDDRADGEVVMGGIVEDATPGRIVTGVPLASGVVVGSTFPSTTIASGIPLYGPQPPRGPLKGTVSRHMLSQFKKLKAANGSPFIDFYRGASTVPSPDTQEPMDVMGLISILPMVGESEFPFLTTTSTANVLFPIALPGDSLSDNTQIATPITEAEIAYAKQDVTVRLRVTGLVECFVAAMGLEAIHCPPHVMFMESASANAMQLAALNDPAQFRSCMRATRLLKAIGQTDTAKGLYEFFASKLEAAGVVASDGFGAEGFGGDHDNTGYGYTLVDRTTDEQDYKPYTGGMARTAVADDGDSSSTDNPTYEMEAITSGAAPMGGGATTTAATTDSGSSPVDEDRSRAADRSHLADFIVNPSVGMAVDDEPLSVEGEGEGERNRRSADDDDDDAHPLDAANTANNKARLDTRVDSDGIEW